LRNSARGGDQHQIAADQKQVKDDVCLRRLIAEDMVARAERKSK
jgi:hypothetical protein